MISRSQLEIINRKTLKYPIHIAEKDYFLTLVLKTISNSNLSSQLIFKGGTALHHCYLNQYRFSEDLDFSTNNKSAITLADLKKVIKNNNLFVIKKQYESKNTFKIEKLQYHGPLIQANSLKIEVDCKQNVLLLPKNRKYQNVWGINFEVATMDIKEICAEKIRAMSDRARYRDFYDACLLIEKYHLDLNDIKKIISKKEIREPITKNKIMTNWKIVLTQKKRELGRIFCSRKIDDKQIQKIIESLPFEKIV